MHWPTATRLASGAIAVLAVVVATAQDSQEPSTTAAPKPLVPLAASSLAEDPEPHYGEYVSVMGTVEKRFSRTVFSVDQDPAHSAKDVLIVAPKLAADVLPNAYVTIIGDVIRFEPATIAQLAKDYVLELTSDTIEQYRGRPAVLANAVITSAMVDLTKRIPPPMTAEEEAFSVIMKRVGPAFTNLRQALGGASTDAVLEQSAVLSQAFGEVEAFWKSRKKTDAIGWAQDARQQTDVVERSARAGNWDGVKASVAALGQACQSCHGAYRERQDDGSYRIKARGR
jgi:cytochrome c556